MLISDIYFGKMNNNEKNLKRSAESPIVIDDDEQPGSSGTSSNQEVIYLSDIKDYPEDEIIQIDDDEEPVKSVTVRRKERIELMHPSILVDPLPTAHAFAMNFFKFSRFGTSEHGPIATVREQLDEPSIRIKRPKIVMRNLENAPEDKENAQPEFTCNICLESLSEIKSAGKKVLTTPCGHPFCSSCLDKSARAGYYNNQLPKRDLPVVSCPKCRKKHALKDRVELFV